MSPDDMVLARRFALPCLEKDAFHIARCDELTKALDWIDDRMAFITELQATNTRLVIENRELLSRVVYSRDLIRDLQDRVTAMQPLTAGLYSTVHNAKAALELGDRLKGGAK